jgi:2-iminobutanoate/2-iminopropanoate deaminase
MANKKIFRSQRAPQAKGPYSQAVTHRGLLYVSGQIPVDPATGAPVRATIEEETDMTLNNLKLIVEDAGSTMDDVLKVTCYLADIEDFPRFNEVYAKHFPFNEVYAKHFPQFPPARTTIQAGKLPLDVQVEIDAIVALPYKKPTRTAKRSGNNKKERS